MLPSRRWAFKVDEGGGRTLPRGKGGGRARKRTTGTKKAQCTSVEDVTKVPNYLHLDMIEGRGEEGKRKGKGENGC